MRKGEQIATNFVQNFYEVTLSAFYLMHENPHPFKLMEDGPLV